jgi:hypothetical protein
VSYLRLILFPAEHYPATVEQTGKVHDTGDRIRDHATNAFEFLQQFGEPGLIPMDLPLRLLDLLFVHRTLVSHRVAFSERPQSLCTPLEVSVEFEHVAEN